MSYLKTARNKLALALIPAMLILNLGACSNPAGDDKSSDATLSALSITYTDSTDATVDVEIGFASSTKTYTATIPYGTESVTVAATVADSAASVSGTGDVDISNGVNTITVTVTAENGGTQDYVITLTCQTLTDTTKLSALSMVVYGTDTTVDISPSFDAATTAYTASVTYDVAKLTITATADDSSATRSVYTNGASSSSTIATLDGDDGINTVVVKVTNGDDVGYYTIAITRATSSDTTLSALTLKSGSYSKTTYALNETFDSETPNYTLNVGYHVTSLSVTATATDSNATVAISGNSDFAVGDNTVTITVTPSDGSDSDDYTVVVTRAQLTVDDYVGSWICYTGSKYYYLTLGAFDDSTDYYGTFAYAYSRSLTTVANATAITDGVAQYGSDSTIYCGAKSSYCTYLSSSTIAYSSTDDTLTSTDSTGATFTWSRPSGESAGSSIVGNWESEEYTYTYSYTYNDTTSTITYGPYTYTMSVEEERDGYYLFTGTESDGTRTYDVFGRIPISNSNLMMYTTNLTATMDDTGTIKATPSTYILTLSYTSSSATDYIK